MKEAKYYESLIAFELILAFFPIVIFWCFGLVYSILVPAIGVEVEFYGIFIPVGLGGFGIWGLFRAYAAVFFPEKRNLKKKVTFTLLGCGLASIAILTYVLGVGVDFRFFIIGFPVMATFHLGYLLKKV